MCGMLLVEAGVIMGGGQLGDVAGALSRYLQRPSSNKSVGSIAQPIFLFLIFIL